MKMFCLVHAGGFAMRYDAMADMMAKKSNDGITLIPLEYAGRGKKYGQPFYSTFDELMHSMSEEIAGMLGPSEPYCLFGHSMGAYAAIETAYQMQKVHHNAPVMTILSGAASPYVAAKQEVGMSNEEMIAYLRDIGGTEENVLRPNCCRFYRRIWIRCEPIGLPMRGSCFRLISWRRMDKRTLRTGSDRWRTGKRRSELTL